LQINGKIALVLGAAKGIGKEIGMNLAEAGAKVVLTCFDWPEESRIMAEEFKSLGYDHLIIKVDLRQSRGVENLFAEIREKYGRLDILINNIERGGMPVVHGPYTSEQWDMEIATTLKAKWWVFKYALPLMKESKEGIVIVLSSIAGIVGRSGPAGLIFNDGYAAANRGISSLVETWAREAAPDIRVNELMLGFFETRHAEKTRGWNLLSAQEKQSLFAHTLLGRSGRLDEIVKAAFFLIQDATYMTGSTLRIDGGYPLGGENVWPMPIGQEDV
jgi:3-oxoacyl-[acyl-carrier protein] reductase